MPDAPLRRERMTRGKLAVLLGGLGLLGLAGVVVAQHAGDRGKRTTVPVADGLRKVEGRAVESLRSPRALVEVLDPAFRYVGGQRFVLYGVANAEQHVFADADAQGRVRRLYWIQFEGYLPSAPFGHYDYSESEATAHISGLLFHADAGWRGPQAPPPGAGSDGALVRQLVANKGLTLPAETLSQRLVWVDEGARDELMFIYLEDLSPLGLTAAELSPGGKSAARAAQVKKDLLTRAAAGLRLEAR